MLQARQKVGKTAQMCYNDINYKIIHGGYKMATWHNAAEKGRIAERIVLVGDPNRAKMIAENYLEDAVLVNDIRCAY